MTVRFAAKINIITDRPVFEKLVSEAPGPESTSPWSAKERVHTEENAWTSGACDCNAGGFTTPVSGMLYHFQTRGYWWDKQGNLKSREAIETWEADARQFHEEEKRALDEEAAGNTIYLQDSVFPQDYETALTGDYAKLKEKHPKVRALLTGGIIYSQASHHLRDFLLGIYTKLGLPYSIFWGGHGAKDLHYSLPKDTWSLRVQSRTKPYNGWYTKTPVERLQTLFSKIAVDPGDTVTLDGDKITSDDLDKAGLLKKHTAKEEELTA